MIRLSAQQEERLLWLGEQVRYWANLVLQAIKTAAAPESVLLSAAISYFTLFSLFPLTLLTVAIASFWLDPLMAESEIVAQLEFVAPALGALLGSNLERIVQARGAVTGFALVIFLWSSSSIFNVLTRAMDQIWEVDRKRPTWRRRGLAVLMALGIAGVLLFASFAAGTIFTVVNSLVPTELLWLRPYTNRFWAALVSMALFGLLYYFLPHISLSWRDVLPGAVLAGGLWELAKRAFLYFVAGYLTRSNLVYGSVATITAFLTWAYLSGIIFLFGAHLNHAYVQATQKPNGETG